MQSFEINACNTLMMF